MKEVFSQSYKQALLDERSKSLLEQAGFGKKDEFFSGPYELYLMHHPHFGYQLGLQTRDTQFANIEQQKSKIPMHEDVQNVDVLAMRNKIASWIQEYGELKVASHDAKKTNKYKSILRAMGFEVRTENMYGAEILLVDV